MYFTGMLKVSALYSSLGAVNTERVRQAASRQRFEGEETQGPMATQQKQSSSDVRSRRRRRSRPWGWLVTCGIVLVLGGSLFLWHLSASSLPEPSSRVDKGTSRGSAGHLGGFQQMADHPALVQGRVPLLFVSAQYCVFCAAERWALVDALGRFGALSHIDPSQSAATDGFSIPIPTYDFTQAQYASTAVDFQHVDVADRDGNALQQLTAEQQAILNTYDPRGGIPFLIIGDQYVQLSSGYSPALLEGLSFAQVKQDLTNPNSAAAQAIHAEGTRITALLCKIGGKTAMDVCQDGAVQADLAEIP